MAGTLELQCFYWLETIFSIISIHSYYIAVVSLFGVAPALVFMAWAKYLQGKKHHLALTSWLFWILWLVIVIATGSIHWVTYFYGGMWCEQYIALALLAVMPFVYALWFITAFIIDSFLIAGIVAVILALWTVASLVINLLFFGEQIAIIIILHALLFFWFVYTAIWTLFTVFFCKVKGFPNLKKQAESIFGVASAGLFKCDKTGCPNNVSNQSMPQQQYGPGPTIGNQINNYTPGFVAQKNNRSQDFV